MNTMNDRVYINKNLMSDGMEAVLLTKLGNNGYVNKGMAENTWVAEAYEHQFHPIKEYLSELKWDGQDHIKKLCTYFKDKDGVFKLY